MLNHVGADRARVADLESCGILAGEAEVALERALHLATELCAAPAGMISFVDAERAWYKARIGIDAEFLPAETCITGLTVRAAQPILCPDMQADPRFASAHPAGGFRFCASVPLISPRGHAIGALCVLDTAPRPDLGLREQSALEDLARLIMGSVEQHRLTRETDAFGRRALLMRELMEVAADAADFASAAQAAAQALIAATGGLTCHLWRRLAGEVPRAQFLVGWSNAAYDSDGYLASLRNRIVTDPASPTMRCLETGQQINIPDITTDEWRHNPILQRAAERGMRSLFAARFMLGEERFAVVLGLGEGHAARIPEIEATMLDTATALRPLLRRIRNEEQTRLFQRIVEATTDAVLITEAEPVEEPGPRIVYANAGFERETGYAEAEVLGRTPRLLQGPGTSKEANDNIGRALRAWQPIRQEILNYRKDGSAFWSELQITPVADSQGWFTHWVSVQRDVTAQREAKATLAAALTERDQLIDHMPGALLRRRCEPGGRWLPLPANPSLYDLTGYEPEESLALDWTFLHTDPAFHVDRDAESELVMRAGRLTSEFRFRHKDGRWIWIRAIRRGYDKPDGAREIISIWTDITPEKQLAEQLAHSAKLAQLGEVTTGMAHELNQPLASISLAAENAQRRLGAAEPDLAGVQQKLDMIVEQTSRIARLIDHMRVFGRMDAVKTGPVVVAGVVENALDMLESKLKGAGVQVLSHVEQDLPPVLGAAIPLEQVIINLLANACDAYGAPGPMPDQRRSITVEARGVGERVRITVQDHAGGIADEILPRIFQPFFTTKGATHGTGLGLSISYGIINDMGGAISARNCDGGAIFTIDLPAVPA